MLALGRLHGGLRSARPVPGAPGHWRPLRPEPDRCGGHRSLGDTSRRRRHQSYGGGGVVIVVVAIARPLYCGRRQVQVRNAKLSAAQCANGQHDAASVRESKRYTVRDTPRYNNEGVEKVSLKMLVSFFLHIQPSTTTVAPTPTVATTTSRSTAPPCAASSRSASATSRPASSASATIATATDRPPPAVSPHLMRPNRFFYTISFPPHRAALRPQ